MENRLTNKGNHSRENYITSLHAHINTFRILDGCVDF